MMDQKYAVLGNILGSGACAQNQQTAIRPSSSLDNALTALAAHVSEVEVVFEKLSDQLKPIKSQKEAGGGKEGNPSAPPNCEIEERIMNLTHRISCLGDYMRSTSAQLCI